MLIFLPNFSPVCLKILLKHAKNIKKLILTIIRSVQCQNARQNIQQLIVNIMLFIN